MNLACSISVRPALRPGSPSYVLSEKLLEDSTKTSRPLALRSLNQVSSKPEARLFSRFRRTAVLRTFIINHIIHHRGQLSVYLRLNNVSVPSIYGPSADEQN
jgi:uncharacterized damage-inducible protein DinB